MSAFEGALEVELWEENPTARKVLGSTIRVGHKDGAWLPIFREPVRRQQRLAVCSRVLYSTLLYSSGRYERGTYILWGFFSSASGSFPGLPLHCHVGRVGTLSNVQLGLSILQTWQNAPAYKNLIVLL